MSAFEALDGSGRVINAYDSKTGITYDRQGYADYKNRSAEARRLLQAMDYRRGNAFNTPLSAMSRVPDATVPDAKSVYEVTGGGGGGAKVKRVILSEPLPDQFSKSEADADEEKPKNLKAKGVYSYYDGQFFHPDVGIELDVFPADYDGSLESRRATVPAQVALEIKVVKGVDYIGIANSTKGRSQDVGEGGVRDGTYDLGAKRDIEDSIFVGFYKMDFGD